MRVIAACALALISAGCGKLFGIEHIPLAGSDAAASDVGDDASIPPGMFQLDVTTLAGVGTVVIDDGDGSPMSCTAVSPVTCSSLHPSGTPITLTTTVDPTTNVFVIWEDACLGQNVNDTGGRPSCILSPRSGDVRVTARFGSSGDAWLALVPDQGSVDDPGSNIMCTTCVPDNNCIASGVCVSILSAGATAALSANSNPECSTFDGYRGIASCNNDTPICSFTPSPAPSVTVVNYNFMTTGSNCSE